MAGQKIRWLLYTGISAFISMGAMNCSEAIHFIPENYDEPVVNLTMAGNDVILARGFTLGKDMYLSIKCLGEGVYDDLKDYGWIINADTRKKVWVMDIGYTEHAGGAKKNRVVEEDIFLKKGSYITFYKTDDSHSYEKWNDTPPDDEYRWGLSLHAKNSDDIKFVSLFDETDYKCRNLLAEVVRVKDNDFKYSFFEIYKRTTIRIYAIGEGTRSEMFDYGWIEDMAGKILWQMDYKKTRYAGGAVKNRLAEDLLVLPAGKYKICFKTDDSHSFDKWNANPPEDAARYGLTLIADETVAEDISPADD